MSYYQFFYIAYVILLHISFANVEATLYKNFGMKNRKQWISDSIFLGFHFRKRGSFQLLSKYHLALWGMFLPIAVFFPAIFYFTLFQNISQFLKLFSLGFGSYILSAVVEDRLFFVFAKHPYNPKDVPWWKWVKIMNLELPVLYYPAIFLGLLFIVLGLW